MDISNGAMAASDNSKGLKNSEENFGKTDNAVDDSTTNDSGK